MNDAPAEMKQDVSERFTIGPLFERESWTKQRSVMDIDRGPCMSSNLTRCRISMSANRSPGSDPLGYVTSVGHREIMWIKNCAVPRAPDDPLLVSTAQNSPEAHIKLLEKFLKVAPYLMDFDRQLACSTLWHPDLHSPNLFVDHNHITAVIDWQGVWAGPLFLQARPSPLVNYQGSMLLKRPDNFDILDDEQKAQVKQQIFKSTLFQLYLLETEERNPTLAQIFQLNHGRTRRLPVEFAGNTWDDDIVSFREALINVERYSRLASTSS